MASRQGLKLTYSLIESHQVLCRQWNGFPSGIETGLCFFLTWLQIRVASGMASRQGLKLVNLGGMDGAIARRQWNGFPSGIETGKNGASVTISTVSPVEWLPVRD